MHGICPCEYVCSSTGAHQHHRNRADGIRQGRSMCGAAMEASVCGACYGRCPRPPMKRHSGWLPFAAKPKGKSSSCSTSHVTRPALGSLDPYCSNERLVSKGDSSEKTVKIPYSFSEWFL